MTGWDDVASGEVEVVLTRDLPGRVFELARSSPVEANDVTPAGQFPEFGTFVECWQTDQHRQTVYLEVCQDFAREMMEGADPREGLVLYVDSTRKARDGSWTVDLTVCDDWEEAKSLAENR